MSVKFLDERNLTTVYVGLQTVARIDRNDDGGWTLKDAAQDYNARRYDTLKEAKTYALRRYGS